MRRVRYYGYGGPEVLTLEEAEPPTPGPGQVLLRAEAIGVNFVDTKFRRGQGRLFQRPLPGRPTGDVVGTVAAVGPGADPALVGRRVAALAEDAYAEQVVADARWLAAVPDGLAPGDATMLPMGAPLALRLLRTARLAPGETVLVHAAAGGIGHLAVQLARILGAGTVIGTTGSPDRLDFVHGLGADRAQTYADPVAGGVDVLLDAVGGPVLRASLDRLAPLGRAVVYGAASGDLENIPVATLFALRTVSGFNITAWRHARPDEARRDIEECAELFAGGRLRTTVHTTLPLADAAMAHDIIESRSHTGRILLTPR